MVGACYSGDLLTNLYGAPQFSADKCVWHTVSSVQVECVPWGMGVVALLSVCVCVCVDKHGLFSKIALALLRLSVVVT